VTDWDPQLLAVRMAGEADLQSLASFTCSTGPAWEQEVENQIQGPLPRRYLAQRSTEFDPRLLLCTSPDDEIIAVAAHLVETVPIARAGRATGPAADLYRSDCRRSVCARYQGRDH